MDAENITIKGEGHSTVRKGMVDGIFRIYVDLEKNGMRELNKYQPLWERENDVEALYAETNEDWHGTLKRRFSSPFIQPVRCRRVRIEGSEDYQFSFWTVNPSFVMWWLQE